MVKEYTIGMLGGMGTFATIHSFRQYAEVFTASKEWDRPRIIIDNRCTMPSRVRAFLYGENKDLLVSQITDSIKHLIGSGCDRIILACNTSHLFLPSVYLSVPEAKKRIISIIDVCISKIKQDRITSVYLLAAEGTIQSGIYQSALESSGISCIAPDHDEFYKLRNCIEAVKQNRYDSKIKKTYLELISRNQNVILGCTEMPVLQQKYQKNVFCQHIYDPVFLTLQQIKKEFENA